MTPAFSFEQNQASPRIHAASISLSALTSNSVTPATAPAVKVYAKGRAKSQRVSCLGPIVSCLLHPAPSTVQAPLHALQHTLPPYASNTSPNEYSRAGLAVDILNEWWNESKSQRIQRQKSGAHLPDLRAEIGTRLCTCGVSECVLSGGPIRSFHSRPRLLAAGSWARGCGVYALVFIEIRAGGFRWIAPCMLACLPAGSQYCTCAAAWGIGKRRIKVHVLDLHIIVLHEYLVQIYSAYPGIVVLCPTFFSQQAGLFSLNHAGQPELTHSSCAACSPTLPGNNNASHASNWSSLAAGATGIGINVSSSAGATHSAGGMGTSSVNSAVGNCIGSTMPTEVRKSSTPLP